ncbi:MAG: ArsR family transcriptional regulator, partial [Streptosporangiaceae bacterium]
MGNWIIGADVLARSRFAISPLAETVSALLALAGLDDGLVQQARARPRRDAYRRRVAADPVAAALVQAAFPATYVADFITTPPRPGDRTIHDELRRVRETPVPVAAADLRFCLGRPLPPVLIGPDLAQHAADLLEWVWTHAVRPDWPRRRALLEADIVARTQRLSSGGWAAALAGMQPGMRWLGDGQLRINAYDNPPRDLRDAQLSFVPTTSSGGRADWDQPDHYAIVYPSRGLLADTRAAAPPDALAALIGPARARILVLLAAPASTTQLVAVTGYTLGSVGGHLRVLLDAGLVRRRRSGRSVLYYRTPAGDQLTEAPPVSPAGGR